MLKTKIDVNAGNRIQKVNQKNNELDKTLLTKVNYFVEFEFIFEFKNILNKSKSDFMNIIMIKLKNFVSKESLSKNIDENNFKLLMNQIKEKWEKKYDNHLTNLSSGLKNFEIFKKNKQTDKNNEKDKFFLKNFIYHCSYTTEYALHNCDKNNKIFGKYILIKNISNNKNINKYVICEKCRKVYFIEYFLNYCEKCKINYYSCENHEKKEFYPAALKSPHCEPVVNEKLNCFYCKSILYINPVKKVVKCLNCRYISSPDNIRWKCNICAIPFKSDVILYNKCEVNYVKKVINYGLLIKKRAHPFKLPCCKNIDLNKTAFYHKKTCKGILFLAEFNKKLIIICDKCKAINNFANFIWTCPQCSLRFKDTKWQEGEFKLRKEFTMNNSNKIISVLNGKNINIFLENKKYEEYKGQIIDERESKNMNINNQEFPSDNQLKDLIKVKRNN